jgi:hypothetical protein
MDTKNFKVHTNNECKASKIVPDQKAINHVIASARKKHLSTGSVIIARYEWLRRNKLPFPIDMDMPNLCLTVKEGKLIRAFYSNVLTHVIKKQNYYIQILN